MGQAFRYPNLLRGTRDLGGCHHPKEEISVAHDGGLGFAVARLAPTTTAGGLVFDDQDVPESERAGGAAFCLSFLARADVAGDRIHSEVWGSRYALDATLGTGVAARHDAVRLRQGHPGAGVPQRRRRQLGRGPPGAADGEPWHHARSLGTRRGRGAGRGGCSDER
jgi:hypothetical protein